MLQGEFLSPLSTKNCLVHEMILHCHAGTGELAQLDLQSIQHRDYFGHLSIYRNGKFKGQNSFCAASLKLSQVIVVSRDSYLGQF